MEETYRVEDITPQIYRGAVSMLTSKILAITNRVDCYSIDLNVYLAVSIEDSERYYVAPIKHVSQNWDSVLGREISENDPYGEENWHDEPEPSLLEKYQIGYLAGFRIFVDPCMKMDDNRIIFKNEKGEVLYTLNVEDPNYILL